MPTPEEKIPVDGKTTYSDDDKSDELYFVARQYDSMDDVVIHCKELNEVEAGWIALRVKSKSGVRTVEDVSFPIKGIDFQNLSLLAGEFRSLQARVNATLEGIQTILDNATPIE